MKQLEERRIYVAVAGTIQVPVRTVIQPVGRQVAQACHAVSKLRIEMHNGITQEGFEPITTIVLQARDSAELFHVYELLRRKKLDPVIFQDNNNPEYGLGDWPTAIAVYATKKQISGILDYLPLWGAK
jgi:hypothetical protein